MQFSSAVRTAQADALETSIGTAPKLRVYDGAMPADCATARAGTLLGTATLPTDWLSAASAGLKTLLGTWSLTSGADGLGRYFSIFDSGVTTCHVQGLLSMAYVNSKAVVVGHHLHVTGTNSVYRCTTAGSTNSTGTGPTGTGSGITDGTAVFTYVGAIDMVLDNVSIANGQVVQVSTFSYTRGNA